MPNPEFAFTMKELWLWILAVCGGVITISSCIGTISGWRTSLKKPNKDQDARMDKIENRLKQVEERCDLFDKQLEGVKKHLNNLDESINMLLRAEFAQLGHNLNGDNVEQMQRAFDDIQEFLFKR